MKKRFDTIVNSFSAIAPLPTDRYHRRCFCLSWLAHNHHENDNRTKPVPHIVAAMETQWIDRLKILAEAEKYHEKYQPNKPIEFKASQVFGYKKIARLRLDKFYNQYHAKPFRPTEPTFSVSSYQSRNRSNSTGNIHKLP